jgi:DNA polymerase-3 subunit alpha
MTSKFSHLHVHTEYSLLDGLPKIKKLVAHTKDLGMDSIAITDHGVMYGVVEFYKEATKEGIKPIIGMEGYVVTENHKKKDSKSKTGNFHIVLLAKNIQGYKNLMKLTSIAHIEGFYYRPRFDRKTLKKYSKGLICASACAKGEIGQALIHQNHKKAVKIAKWYQSVFGDDYYLELQRHFWDKFAKVATNPEIKSELLRMNEGGKKVNDGIIKISRQLGIPIIATNDVHYIKKEDAEAQDALVCISTGKNVSDIKRLRYIDVPDFYLKSPSEMADVFPDLSEAINNTVKVAQKCNLKITLGQWFFPKIKMPKGTNPETLLKRKARSGLKKRYKKITKELRDRLNYELDVITSKGYASYFLIYEDMASWAYRQNIPINTRGSVAGSIVSYSLGITTVDPIKYMLPFERFLNPFRPSAPDIDLDISDDKREEMISYLVNKYGQTKVAQICTFGRMLARGSVRDVARVLGYPYDTGDKISKLIPLGTQGFPMTIERALNESLELGNLYDSDEDAKKILDFSRQIEGNARHISVHAAGIVISPSELTNFSPVQLEPSGDKKITQYEMHSCEDVGLIKLDVLGIKNLSILRESIELVRTTEKKTINLDNLPLDDKKTYDMLSRGETIGVFQFSGSGITRFLKQLQPERIEDIMAMIALYRPGPMANIPEFIARKKGEKKTKYYHPKMEKFLDKSLGILVYQDDLLFTAIELAGYDWKVVDKLRKAVGKKIPEEMAKQHKIFVDGCIKHSQMTKKQAEEIWNLFEPFQGYGFNKAHAASYGMVAYWTAYMKANYPVEFMCALMTAECGDSDKLALAVQECKRLGINVLSPDINQSDVDFNIIDDIDSKHKKAIRFGLNAVKNVGKAAIEAIFEERNNEEFHSFADFLARVDARRVNKKVLESLIKVGAFSKFGNRATLLSLAENLKGRVSKPQGMKNQQELFAEDELKKTMQTKSIRQDERIDELEEIAIQNFERELLGLSLSARPINEVIGHLQVMATHKIQDLPHEEIHGEVKVAIVVSETRVVITKKTGREMAFVKAKDDTGNIDLVVFPQMFQSTREQWVDNTPLLVTGKINYREDDMSLVVNKVEDNSTIEMATDSLFIKVPKNAGPIHLKKLKTLLVANPGEQNVSLMFEGNGKNIKLNLNISWTEVLARKISEILEESNN